MRAPQSAYESAMTRWHQDGRRFPQPMESDAGRGGEAGYLLPTSGSGAPIYGPRRGDSPFSTADDYVETQKPRFGLGSGGPAPMDYVKTQNPRLGLGSGGPAPMNTQNYAPIYYNRQAPRVEQNKFGQWTLSEHGNVRVLQGDEITRAQQYEADWNRQFGGLRRIPEQTLGSLGSYRG